MCYIANVGDSRAILSTYNGREIKVLTNDHDPILKKRKKEFLRQVAKFIRLNRYIKTLLILEII
jgi:serine/threonine protein phosphatase PrpC